MPTQGFWLKTKKETFQKYLKDGQINLIYTNYTHLQISKVELTVAINLSRNSYSKPINLIILEPHLKLTVQ